MSVASPRALALAGAVIGLVALSGRPAGADEAFSTKSFVLQFQKGTMNAGKITLSLRGSYSSSDPTPPNGFDVFDADGINVSADFDGSYWATTCTQLRPTGHVKCTNFANTLKWDSAGVPDRTGVKAIRMRAKYIDLSMPRRPFSLPITSVVLRRASMATLVSMPTGCSVTTQGALKCRQ